VNTISDFCANTALLPVGDGGDVAPSLTDDSAVLAQKAGSGFTVIYAMLY